MSNRLRKSALCLALAALPAVARAQGTLPPDVKPGHWAAPAARRALATGLIAPRPGGKFGGDAKATRTETVLALAKLAQALDARAWPKARSRALPEKSTMATLRAPDWQTRPVTRYALAATLTGAADYVANGLPTPARPARDLGKSEVTPRPVKASLPAGHPAKAALDYLVRNRMVRAGSPLLKPDSRPVLGQELSTGLADVMIAVADRHTPVGKDALGNSTDANSPPR